MNKSELQYKNRLLQERVERLEKYIKEYVAQAERTIDALILKSRTGPYMEWDCAEQIQENLLTYFAGVYITNDSRQTILDGMCDVIIKTINDHEE